MVRTAPVCPARLGVTPVRSAAARPHLPWWESPLAYGAVVLGAGVLLRRADLLERVPFEAAASVTCAVFLARSVTHLGDVGDGLARIGDGMTQLGNGVASVAASLDGVGEGVKAIGLRCVRCTQATSAHCAALTRCCCEPAASRRRAAAGSAEEAHRGRTAAKARRLRAA